MRDLHKAYGTVTAVDHISFEVQRGEIIGVVGPNGAGKTTTVEALAGLRKPGSGFVRVLGIDPARQKRELRQRIGIQLQNAALPEELQVWEALDLFASFYAHRADWKILIDTWGLAEKYHTRFSNLSGSGALLVNVAAGLAEAGVVPPDLRSEQVTLEDVFLSLTGREIRTE